MVFFIFQEKVKIISSFSENNFIQNTAQEAGGVFFCDKTGEGNPSCQCTNCVFNQNKASSYGDKYASDIARLTRIGDGNIDYHEEKMYMTLGNTISNKLEYQVLDNYNQIISSPIIRVYWSVILFL